MTDQNGHLLPDEEEDYTPDILRLENEDGEEHVFEVLDVADMHDVRYMMLRPYSEDPGRRLADSAEMLIVRLDENGDEVLYDLVDDQEELASVIQVFSSRWSEVYNIDLEELLQELSELEE